jgi:hypothetical protein
MAEAGCEAEEEIKDPKRRFSAFRATLVERLDALAAELVG